jgi:hypothetical protein
MDKVYTLGRSQVLPRAPDDVDGLQSHVVDAPLGAKMLAPRTGAA